MKKIFLIVAGCFLITSVFAQTDSLPEAKGKSSPISLAGRANDHLLVQFGYAGWSGKPDSINTKGIPRSFNIYFMLDFPFKTDPRFSAAIGPGLGTDNIYFDKTSVGIKELTPTLRFQNQKDTTHFKKNKLTTTYLEVPVELRFSADPVNSKKGFKAALGLKIGTMLKAQTKGKTLQNSSGTTLNNYTDKISNKRFFNTTRFAAIARVGYGNFSLYGTYQINSFFKEGLGPDVKPFSIGLTISGL